MNFFERQDSGMSMLQEEYLLDTQSVRNHGRFFMISRKPGEMF